MSESREASTPAAADAARGVPVLAATRLHQLRRARGADRDHASRARRRAPLDLRAAVPPRAQLLHAAPRSGSATTRDLHRMAAASHLGRHRGWRAFRGAVAVAADRPVMALRRLRRCPAGRRGVRRRQAGGCRNRRACGVAHRQPRLASSAAMGDRRRRVRRVVRVRSTVPRDHSRGRGDRRGRWTLCACGIQWARPCIDRESRRNGGGHRRRNAAACACALFKTPISRSSSPYAWASARSPMPPSSRLRARTTSSRAWQCSSPRPLSSPSAARTRCCPYVNQAAVQTYGWLTAEQMIDGLALGETTPGPLIMVVAFVGFVGAWTKAALGPDALALAGIAGASCRHLLHLPAVVSFHPGRRTARRIDAWRGPLHGAARGRDRGGRRRDREPRAVLRPARIRDGRPNRFRRDPHRCGVHRSRCSATASASFR